MSDMKAQKRNLFKVFRKKKKKRELKWSVVTFLSICWLVPTTLVLLVSLFIVTNRMYTQVEVNVLTSANKTAKMCMMRLEGVCAESRKVNYYGHVYDSYLKYRESGDEQELYNEINDYLIEQYRFVEDVRSTALVILDDSNLFYSTFGSGSTYERIQSFRERCLSDVIYMSGRIDTNASFYKDRGSLYLVRNLMDDNYKPYAVMVMEINTDTVFEGMKSIWGYECCAVYIDNVRGYGEDLDREYLNFFARNTSNDIMLQDREGYYAVTAFELEGQRITYVINIDGQIITSEIRTVLTICMTMLLSLIPLFGGLAVFFKNRITSPMDRLLKAATEISGGNYGYVIEEEGSSTEFEYLFSSFNSMSEELKYQFETIYQEELALKDANLKALQQQINPHFLNNTLEIINWEARMNGVESVSDMISALSTMLDATLNRLGETTIPLQKELEYVDAYLYIIEVRMGDDVTISKKIDETLLDVHVPKLIIQPVIENAVEHGLSAGRGYINIEIFSLSGIMYVQIRNSGHMSEEDKEKVDALLNDSNYEAKGSVSIGVRNVNKRLKLIYGEESGLYFDCTDDEILFELRIKLDTEEE